MTKNDKIGAALRKFDYLWGKKGGKFCDIVKLIYKEELENISEFLDDKVFEISDDELMERLKNIDVNLKDKY